MCDNVHMNEKSIEKRPNIDSTNNYLLRPTEWTSEDSPGYNPEWSSLRLKTNTAHVALKKWDGLKTVEMEYCK